MNHSQQHRNHLAFSVQLACTLGAVLISALDCAPLWRPGNPPSSCTCTSLR
uniref:Uncharacterized protein n=1 Tax=Arundo donax TaxID=35708 RepID=A0A0A9FA26_ARUDO